MSYNFNLKLTFKGKKIVAKFGSDLPWEILTIHKSLKLFKFLLLAETNCIIFAFSVNSSGIDMKHD